MAALLALGAALAWGTGDFLGGLASRRARVLTVLAISQLTGLVGLTVWLVVSRDPWPGMDESAPAVGAGIAGAVGLAALYRGLALGAMAIVAPISAASPIVPLAVDAINGSTPGARQWLGIAAVLTGIAVLSRGPGGSGGRRTAAGVGLALVAALGFGLFIVGIDAAADESVPWAVTTARGTATVLALAAALATRSTLRPARALIPLLLAVGVFDTGANVLVTAATTFGSAGIVAVLSALYPVTTIVLARLVLGERVDRWRRAGGAVALCGAALVAAGGG
jgi:drug/metabolite transporter (DMT)-like permease